MTTRNPFTLDSKCVLVTGASSGIGRATAIECATVGAQVVLTGRDTSRLDETHSLLVGSDHQKIVADLTEQGDLSRLVEECPMLDGVVLCAGKGKVVPFRQSTRDKFDDVFSVNFFAPTELLRLLVRAHKLKDGASVVYVASIGGCPGGKFTVGNGIYGASKAAGWSLMRFAALELSSKLIRVNCVMPGMVETPLIHGGMVTEEQHQKDMESYPLKRYGQPTDVAYGIIYLLSNASSWVTGQTLIIDGGCSL